MANVARPFNPPLSSLALLVGTFLILLSAVAVFGDDDHLIWEDRLDVAGKVDLGEAVTIAGNNVVVGGTGTNADGTAALLHPEGLGRSWQK